MKERYSSFIAALVAVPIGRHVEAVFTRHGVAAAIITLIFAMATVEACKGWLKHLRK